MKILGLRTLSMLILAIGVFRVEDSWALCSASSSTVIFPAPITIQRDTPVGEVVATNTITTVINCDNAGNGAGWSWTVHPAAANVDLGPSSVSNVRLTNVSGIGIRWTNNNDNSPNEAIWTRKSLNDTSGGRGIRGNGRTVFTDRFELIKLGPVASVISPSWTLAYGYFGNANNIDRGRLFGYTASGQSLKVVACSVYIDVISINMGDVRKTEFTGVGSSVREMPVKISLGCDANTKVNVTLSGTPHSSGAAGVLALTPSATHPVATGVGLQLLYNNAAVTFGMPIAAGVAANSGAYSIPLTARYYQTAGTITEGQANSTATFTMSYR